MQLRRPGIGLHHFAADCVPEQNSQSASRWSAIPTARPIISSTTTGNQSTDQGPGPRTRRDVCRHSISRTGLVQSLTTTRRRQTRYPFAVNPCCRAAIWIAARLATHSILQLSLASSWLREPINANAEQITITERYHSVCLTSTAKLTPVSIPQHDHSTRSQSSRSWLTLVGYTPWTSHEFECPADISDLPSLILTDECLVERHAWR